MDYAGSTCPRCDAEERHSDLLNATAESAAATVAAAHESDHRRANPGDYACPHCKYISLNYDAARCPLCRGEIGGAYWNDVRAEEKAAAERRRAQEEEAAAEWIRTAPQRAAAEAEALVIRQRIEQAAKNKATVGYAFGGGAYAGLVGLLLGAIIGFGKGCVNWTHSQRSLSEPFIYIPETALIVCIVGASIGFVVGAIIGQNK